MGQAGLRALTWSAPIGERVRVPRPPSRPAVSLALASLLAGVVASPAPAVVSAAGMFAAPVPYASGDSPHSVILADLNEDTKLDLVVGNADADTLSIRLGTGTGTFGDRLDVSVGDKPKSVVAVDVDGDGHLDLATANQEPSTMSVLLGHGDGTFEAAPDDDTCLHGHEIATGDFDEDDDADLAVVCWGQSSISIHLGNGDGTFAAKVLVPVGPTGQNPHSLVVGRFDANAHDDIAVANRGTDQVAVLLGTGTGTFAPVVHYGVGDAPHSVRAGDVNGDGKADLVTANDSANTVSVLLGAGNGTFATSVAYGTGTGKVPKGVALADVDLDGHLDILTANTGGNGDGVTGKPGGDVMSVLLGHGDGTFAAATAQAAGQTSFALATGRLDADTRPDVVTANWDGDAASVLLNTTGAPPSDTTDPVVGSPTIRFVQPSTASATAIAARVTWTASDADSGLASFVVSRSVDGATAVPLATLGAAARSLTTTLAPTHAYVFTVRAIDAAGNDASASSAPLRPTVYYEGTSLSTFTGTWRAATYANAIGGRTRYATAPGASVTFRFSGREVALVAPVSATRGQAKVYVDGVYRSTISLYAATPKIAPAGAGLRLGDQRHAHDQAGARRPVQPAPIRHRCLGRGPLAPGPRGQSQATGFGVGRASPGSAASTATGRATSMSLGSASRGSLGRLEPELLGGGIEGIVQRRLVPSHLRDLVHVDLVGARVDADVDALERRAVLDPRRGQERQEQPGLRVGVQVGGPRVTGLPQEVVLEVERDAAWRVARRSRDHRQVDVQVGDDDAGRDGPERGPQGGPERGEERGVQRRAGGGRRRGRRCRAAGGRRRCGGGRRGRGRGRRRARDRAGRGTHRDRPDQPQTRDQ